MVTSRSPDGVSDVPTDRDHRALCMAEKRARRAQFEAELGERQRTLPEKRHGVIYADLPWRFEPTGKRRLEMVTALKPAGQHSYRLSAYERKPNSFYAGASDAAVSLLLGLPRGRAR
jgi:hypothetical protein